MNERMQTIILGTTAALVALFLLIVIIVSATKKSSIVSSASKFVDHEALPEKKCPDCPKQKEKKCEKCEKCPPKKECYTNNMFSNYDTYNRNKCKTTNDLIEKTIKNSTVESCRDECNNTDPNAEGYCSAFTFNSNTSTCTLFNTNAIKFQPNINYFEN